MSRILVEKYIFTPGVANEGIIKFPGKTDLNKLLVITNKTLQDNIYALGDPTRSGTATYDPDDNSTFYATTDGVTTVTLTRDTSLMLSTDELAIYTDAPKSQGVMVRPYAFGTDAIERMRVANPQSLIDADFEYGLQPTKWQNYTDIRNIPGIYERPGLDLFVNNVTTNGSSPSLITVTTSAPHTLNVNDPVIIYSLGNTNNYARAEGAFIINTVPDAYSFTYYAKGPVGTSGLSIYTGTTYGRRGGFYAASQLSINSVSSDEGNPSKISVTCNANHGLVPGSSIVGIGLSSGTNHNLLSGNFFIEEVPSPNAFIFTARVGGPVAYSGISMDIFTRSDAFSIHRPFDGGVQLGNSLPSHGASISRQTKKYMRYQSGKGILWTSGVLLNPVLNLDQISAAGTEIGSLITVSSEMDHSLQVGATIEITGVVTGGYNGTYGVNTILNENTFTVVANQVLENTDAVITNLPRITVKGWHGATVRVGPFDDQNGLFWEFDGQELAVVKRSSTYQLSGFIHVTPGSQAIVGNSTRFTQQLRVGDRIVIRGMTYMVGTIDDDTHLTVNPAYRGVDETTGIKMAVTLDERIPQSQFNVDKLDGTGDSGYKINLQKMQMMGIQFSWYGAGFIDFMLRGPDGNMIIAHRMKQNNKNDEAYMRSGNAAVRYQSINESVHGLLAEDMTDSQDYVVLQDASRFPATGGVVYLQAECIKYTGKLGNTLTGCTRGATFQMFAGGVNRSFKGRYASTHAVGNGNNSVILISVTCSPQLCHWGSSYIMDGGFDSDRGYYFNYAGLNHTIPTGESHTLFLLRLAPSVSNSISGDLGQRDLINRSQLLLQKLQVQSNQSVQVYGILNPGNIQSANLDWTSVNTVALGSQPSFAQISGMLPYAATPGEQIFSTLGQPDGFSEIDLTALKELTNSAIGGYSNYPDGPDVLAVVVKNLTIGTTEFNVTKTTTGPTSKYRINGYNNPTLTVYRGQTYTFTLDSAIHGHPFWIKTTDTNGSTDAYNTGVTNNGANPAVDGTETITWTVDIDAPDTLYYHCEYHTADHGTITVLDRIPANVNVNLFWSEAQA